VRGHATPLAYGNRTVTVMIVSPRARVARRVCGPALGTFFWEPSQGSAGVLEWDGKANPEINICPAKEYAIRER
jgi:hypothetical protein